MDDSRQRNHPLRNASLLRIRNRWVPIMAKPKIPLQNAGPKIPRLQKIADSHSRQRWGKSEADLWGVGGSEGAYQL